MEAWKEMTLENARVASGLDPVKLIPAMVRYEQTRGTLLRAAVDDLTRSADAATAVSAPKSSLGFSPEAAAGGGRDRVALTHLFSPAHATNSGSGMDAMFAYLSWILEEGRQGCM
ncbi:hypothetical protein EON66_07640, partial [archaeon]